MAGKKSFLRDESGTAIIEVTVTFLLFITVLFGVVEFSYAFYQWNAATKAMQLGARYAAVSDPVLTQLPSINGLASKGVNAGDPYVANAYLVVCTGSNRTCTCTGPECPGTKTYSQGAMDNIVASMDRVFPRIAAQNVTITYAFTSLGYAGRPGGPVPTITVQLTGLNFNFILLSAILGRNSIPMPDFATTVTGEDLSASWSSS